LEETGINCRRTPPESPDLNPIENVWHELKFYLETKVKPQTKQELVAGIKKFWARKIAADKCTRYIDHVLPKVIPAIVAKKTNKRKKQTNGSFRSHQPEKSQ